MGDVQQSGGTEIVAETKPQKPDTYLPNGVKRNKNGFPKGKSRPAPLSPELKWMRKIFADNLTKDERMLPPVVALLEFYAEDKAKFIERLAAMNERHAQRCDRRLGNARIAQAETASAVAKVVDASSDEAIALIDSLIAKCQPT